MRLVFVFCGPFNVGLDSPIWLCVHFVANVALCWKYTKKSGLTQMCVFGRERFNSFRQSRLFCLIPYQNLGTGSFLKVRWDVKSETVRPLCTPTLKPIWSTLLGVLNGCPTWAWFGNIMDWSFGKYKFVELHGSSEYWHVIMQCLKFFS